MKVLVLGAGKMVEAILQGLKEKENLSDWSIYSPSGASASKLAGKVGAQAVTDLKSVKNPDWILVGCKPQQLQDLKKTIGDLFNEGLFVSILAAISEDEQRRILGVKELIRVMPNLPVAFGEGVVLMSSSSSSRARAQSFQALFSKLGVALVVEEGELEELTLLTGSGPAFFYEFSKSLAASFTSLDEEKREKLARQVLKGCAVTVSREQGKLTEMIDAVTSKGGVTIAVLNEWRSLGFQEFLKKGLEAGKKRTEEIKSLLRS